MFRKALRVWFGSGFGLLITVSVMAQPIHPFKLPQPANAPELLLALVEIPKGSTVKYEIDPEHGGLVVDRLLPETHRYPAHYGGLPSVMAVDGDLADVLVITTAPLVSGSLIEVVPVGLAKMRDGGEPDDKVIAIPRDTYNRQSVSRPSLSLIDPGTLASIERFFTTYKTTEGESNPIEWQGFVGAEELEAWWSEANGHHLVDPYQSGIDH